MTNENDVYGKLAASFGYAGSQRFIKILKVLISPEEGKLLLEIPAWTTCEQLAKRLNINKKDLQARLDNLVQRGLVAAGKQGYICPPDLHQLQVRIIGSLDKYISPEFHDLYKDFRFTEELPSFAAAWLRRKYATGLAIHRVLPARKALEASPNIRPEQILWYEDIAEIIRRAEDVALHDCGCRRICRNCNNPLWVHLQLGKGGFGGAASRESRGRTVTHEEAIAAMDSAEESGLVHIGMNNAYLGLVCCCCDDCCIVIPTAMRYVKKAQDIISPSRFRARVDQELCAGCQTCIERCYFYAVEMGKNPYSKKLKAKVIVEQCMGCGNCVITCPQKALTLELVRPPEHIPVKPVVPSAAQPAPH